MKALKEKIRSWMRHKIMLLIADDIQRETDRAYSQGCYITRMELSAQKRAEMSALMAESERLHSMLIDNAALAQRRPFIIKAGDLRVDENGEVVKP